MNVRRETERLAENPTLQVLARIAMLTTPALCSIIAAVAWYWLISIQSNVNAAAQDIAALRERTSVVENNQTRGRADRQNWQQETTEQLRMMAAQIQTLTANLAALDSTLRAQQRQIDERR